MDVFEDNIELLVDKLNQLNDENQELKQNCKTYTWYKQYKILLNENAKLESDYEELQEILKQYETIIKKNWFKIHKKRRK